MQWPIIDRPALRHSIEEALTERPARAVMVTGPAGAGKTTLAGQVAARRRQSQGDQLFTVAALAELSDVPLAAFAPVVQLLGVSRADGVRSVVRGLMTELGSHASSAVLVVDDAPLLDPASAAVVYQVVRAFGLPTVLTARSGVPLGGPIERLRHENLVREVEVSGLELPAVEEVVRTYLGAPPRPDDVQRLRTVSDGNPLYLRELMNQAERSGRIHRSPSGITIDSVGLRGDISTSISDRISQLEEADLEVLQVIALGAGAPIDVLCPLARDRVRAERLIDADIVREMSQDGLRPAHPLYRDAAVKLIGPDDQQRMYSTVADRLEETGDPTLRFAAVRLRIDSGGPSTTEDLQWAASYAYGLGEHAVAVELTEAARTDDDRRLPFTAVLNEATSLSHLARLDDADTAFTRAAELAETTDNIAVLISRWGSHLAYRRFDAASALGLANRLADRLDPASQKSLQPILATWRLLIGESTDARKPDSLDGPASDTSPELIVRAAMARVMLDAMSGRASAEVAEQLVAVESEYGILDPMASAMVHLQQYFHLLSLGEGAAAQSAIEQQRATCPPDAVGLWSYTLGIHVMYSGRLDDAADLARLAVDQLSWRDPIGLLGAAIALRAAVEARRGETAAARAFLNDLLPVQRAEPKAAMLIAEAEALLLAEGGDIATAEAIITAAAQGAWTQGHHLVAAISLGACLHIGSAHQAADLLGQIRADVNYIDGLYGALHDTADALHKNAFSRLVIAARRLADGGMAAAAVAALEHAEKAARKAKDAGAIYRLTSARVALERAFGQRPTRTRTRLRDEVTQREWEVVELVRDRLSSPEIASALGLSRRTVDNHLQSVYRKMGISGRPELRALLAEDALTDV